MIIFSDFANHLYPYLKEGRNRSDFVIYLFDQILDDDASNPFSDKSGSTLRPYIKVNSPRPLPTNDIRDIMPHVQPGKFQAYLDTLSDDITEKLVNEFSPFTPGLTMFNFSSVCADLFDAILEAVANPPATAPALVPAMTPELSESVIAKYGPRLLMEAENLCPHKGCTNLLSETAADGSIHPLYRVALIDPQSDISYSNLIPLCPACHARYISMPSPATRKALMKKKQLMAYSASIKQHYSEQKIEEGIEQLLRKIAEIPEAELEKFKTSAWLRYDPVVVRKKLPADSFANRRLLKAIIADVSEYFYMVDFTLKQLNLAGVIRPRKLAQQIKGLFISLDEEGLSYTNIFNGIRDWIACNTHEEPELCSIVVAYFVQSCEVFDVISE